MTNIKPVEGKGDIDAFLAKVKSLAPARKGGPRGRLILAMDATMSRQPAWDTALAIQGQMFEETAAIGGLDVQLVYFRGFDECRASKWMSDANALARAMARIDCRGGHTQIGRVLKHIRQEGKKNKVDACVYVGDALEEGIDGLCRTAGEIGLMGVPLFMFQEGGDPLTESGYREIARLSRGAYFRFDSGSARILRELLSAVAVYAAGGHAALADHSSARAGAARLLLEQLK